MPSSGDTTHRYPGLVLATLAIANEVALLDLFVVNVALHDIRTTATTAPVGRCDGTVPPS